jgi:hypothetical protein
LLRNSGNLTTFHSIWQLPSFSNMRNYGHLLRNYDYTHHCTFVNFRYGLECLFRFFSYGLETKFRPELYKDFQTETVKDCEAGQLYALEKFWAFVKYYKHADELHVLPKLKKLLDPFNTIEDFKILYTVRLYFRLIITKCTLDGN